MTEPTIDAKRIAGHVVRVEEGSGLKHEEHVEHVSLCDELGREIVAVQIPWHGEGECGEMCDCADAVAAEIRDWLVRVIERMHTI